MRTEKDIIITIKPVFNGIKSNTESFIDLILTKERENKNNGNLDFDQNIQYNRGVVLSDIHASKRRASQ